MPAALSPHIRDERMRAIRQARQHWLNGQGATGNGPASSGATPLGVDSAITRSWQRCLTNGRDPKQRVVFEAVSRQQRRAAQEAHLHLRDAARPALSQLERAVAGTRYFALLTDAHGIVIDTAALTPGAPRAAQDIARIGVDLSEAAVGTTAIGLALAEQRSVWLHRGEHFFEDNTVYSCAGAPFFDPLGRCAGMLDLTGVDVPERPELQHLAGRAAGAISASLLLALPAALWLQFNWPGALSAALPAQHLGLADQQDGLLALDEDGCVLGANASARALLAIASLPQKSLVTEWLAAPVTMLFDAASRPSHTIELPLWSGLRLQARAWRPGAAPQTSITQVPASARRATGLRDLQEQLIAQAVRDAQGNVAQAARVLGVSRATVYRKLGSARSHT